VVPSSHTYSCNDNSSANLPLNLGPPLNNVKLCEPVKTTACLLSTSNKLCDRPLFGDVLLSTSKSTHRATSRAFVCQFQGNSTISSPPRTAASSTRPLCTVARQVLRPVLQALPANDYYSISRPTSSTFTNRGCSRRDTGQGCWDVDTYTNLHKNSNNIIYYIIYINYNIISFYNFFIYRQTRRKT
jgi:hypothetical protein